MPRRKLKACGRGHKLEGVNIRYIKRKRDGQTILERCCAICSNDRKNKDRSNRRVRDKLEEAAPLLPYTF